jgi:branched-subunit amino acid transport protein
MPKKTHSIHIPTKNDIYSIIVSIILIFFISFSVANAIYFAALANRPSVVVSQNAAKAMEALNIVVTLLGSGLFVWTLWKLFTVMEKKKELYGHVKEAIENKT